jgi:hypothetical protein
LHSPVEISESFVEGAAAIEVVEDAIEFRAERMVGAFSDNGSEGIAKSCSGLHHQGNLIHAEGQSLAESGDAFGCRGNGDPQTSPQIGCSEAESGCEAGGEGHDSTPEERDAETQQE